MAVHPGAVIAVAGLAVAGFRLYTALSNSAQIVRSSLERYNDEKIRYYTVNKQVLEKVVDYGKFKLELWDELPLISRFSRRLLITVSSSWSYGMSLVLWPSFTAV